MVNVRETLSKEYETWCRNLEEVKLQYKSFVELSDVQISKYVLTKKGVAVIVIIK